MTTRHPPALVVTFLIATIVACGGAGALSTAASTGRDVSPCDDSGANLLSVFSPRCGASDDLAAEVFQQMLLLNGVSPKLGARARTIEPESVSCALRANRKGFLFFYYAGHGNDATHLGSQLCLEPAQSQSARSSEYTKIDDLATTLPTTLGGAVFVIDACESANVDPRRAPIPFSVISASPFSLRTDSLFGDVFARALDEVTVDPNCDGIITDQELFDQIVLGLDRRPAMSALPAYPKLRREAPSHVPLPIRPRKRNECVDLRRRISEIVGRSGPALGALGKALQTQLDLVVALESGLTPRRLPASEKDYFLIEGDSDDVRAKINDIASKTLDPFPSAARADAEQIARFATFAEVYRFVSRCGWIRIERLRDDALVATRKLDALATSIPQRKSISYGHTLDSKPQLRVLGPVEKAQLGEPEPCYELTGQCFRIDEKGQSPTTEMKADEPRRATTR